MPAIVEAVAGFLKNWSICPDVVIPMPPSKQRSFSTGGREIEIASELSKSLGIALDTTSLKKTKTTPKMKDIGDFSARVAALDAAFTTGRDLEGRQILLIDDLFQSGATMNVAAQTLKARLGKISLRDRAHAHEELKDGLCFSTRNSEHGIALWP